MQDAFRETLRDLVYGRWRIAVYYRNSLKLQELLYGDDVPESLAEEIREINDLISYLEADRLFSPDRNPRDHA